MMQTTSASLPLLRRREFMTVTFAGGASLLLPFSLKGQDAGKVDVWVIHGTDKPKLMRKCLETIGQNGGFGANAKTLALKVNAAWARAPELGANTHPELVETFVSGVKEFGIGTVDVPEHPCNRAEQAFTRSGIQEAVLRAGGTMYDMKSDDNKKLFAPTKLPKGKTLTSAEVTKHFLEADAVVNMPVAKHHKAAVLTMAMKNWMGAVEDRRCWHRDGLHQCIADFSTLVKPTWTIIDATRVMLVRGPQGGNVAFLKKPAPNLLIVSKDQVAADAYATMLFKKTPADIEYLGIAKEMGLGVTDLEQMNIHNVEA